MLKTVFFDLGDTLIVEQTDKHLGDAHFDAVPGAEETLTALKRKGLTVGVITNTTVSREPDVRKTLRPLGLERHIDFIITSVDAGHEKPEQEIFALALQATRTQASEAVMVGDQIAKDVVGGNRAGMKTVLFKWNQRYPETATRPEEQPTCTIRHLGELQQALARIDRSPQP